MSLQIVFSRVMYREGLYHFTYSVQGAGHMRNNLYVVRRYKGKAATFKIECELVL